MNKAEGNSSAAPIESDSVLSQFTHANPAVRDSRPSGDSAISFSSESNNSAAGVAIPPGNIPDPMLPEPMDINNSGYTGARKISAVWSSVAALFGKAKNNLTSEDQVNFPSCFPLIVIGLASIILIVLSVLILSGYSSSGKKITPTVNNPNNSAVDQKGVDNKNDASTENTNTENTNVDNTNPVINSPVSPVSSETVAPDTSTEKKELENLEITSEKSSADDNPQPEIEAKTADSSESIAPTDKSEDNPAASKAADSTATDSTISPIVNQQQTISVDNSNSTDNSSSTDNPDEVNPFEAIPDTSKSTESSGSTESSESTESPESPDNPAQSPGVDKPDNGIESDSSNAAISRPAISPQIAQGLNTPLISLTIQERSFTQTLQLIKSLGNLPLEINWETLKKLNVTPEDKISYFGREVTVEKALLEVLSQRGLTYQVKKDSLVLVSLSSVQSARSNLPSDTSPSNSASSGQEYVLKPYNISDLTQNNKELTQQLIQRIQSYLCPGDWTQTGGKGRISTGSNGVISILQNESNHWEIADFLDRLRLARHLPMTNKEVSLDLMTVRGQSALQRKVGLNIEKPTGLQSVIAQIGKQTGVTLLLDIPALKLEGISPDYPFSINAVNLTVKQVLERIGEETQLVYSVINPSSFVLTTVAGQKTLMHVEFFPIKDLIEHGVIPATLMLQLKNINRPTWQGESDGSADVAIDTSRSSGQNTAASNVGKQSIPGTGLIDFDSPSDCLIIRQSDAVHNAISLLFAKLRQSFKS